MMIAKQFKLSLCFESKNSYDTRASTYEPMSFHIKHLYHETHFSPKLASLVSSHEI